MKTKEGDRISSPESRCGRGTRGLVTTDVLSRTDHRRGPCVQYGHESCEVTPLCLRSRNLSRDFQFSLTVNGGEKGRKVSPQR